MKQAGVVVQAEQQRADNLVLFRVTKSSDNAVCTAEQLYFLHAYPFPGGVGNVDALGDNAIKRPAARSQPPPRLSDVAGGGRESQHPIVKKLLCEGFKRGSAFFKCSGSELLAAFVREQIEGDERGRSLFGQFADTALSGMQPQ